MRSHLPPNWQSKPSEISSETVFWNRRKFLKTLGRGAIAAGALSLVGCGDKTSVGAEALDRTLPPPGPTRFKQPFGDLARNPNFADPQRAITPQKLAASYNNFYEFGETKSIQAAAQRLPTDPWTIEVGGLVQNPTQYDRDDLFKAFDLEERIYRFRCVEAWAMVVPWIGFPMRKILETADPKPSARYVKFTSFYDPKITTGPRFSFGGLPWPYVESLRIDEMANDLAFFAVGAYGELLPKQHGAPIRSVLPWKYGFKGPKSIVKIEFVDEQPATFWNTLVPNEYGFVANVEPDVPHPRWSQASERLIGDGPALSWKRVPTLPYNGYGEFVANLYA